MSSKTKLEANRGAGGTADLAKEMTAFGLEALDARKVLRTALRNGGDLAEFYFEETSSTRVIFEDGRVDQVVDGNDRGVGLRIIYDRKSVYGYTTELTERSLLSLAEALSEAVPHSVVAAVAERAAPSMEWRYPRQDSSAILGYSVKKRPRDHSLSQKIELARMIDSGARRELPQAKQVTAVILDTERRILVVNSDGLVASDLKVYLSAFAEVVGEKDGRFESAHHGDGGFVGMEFFESSSDPAEIGRIAARRVRILLEAKPAPAGSLPVVLSAEAGGTMIHEAVGHGLEADLACNGLSVYQGKLGQQVASPLITVIDDGTLPEKRGSFAFDDEGTPSRKNVLIENGVLKSYLVDRLSAMKFDMMATGSGRRESFRHKPIVRMTNTYIAPGKDDSATILRDTAQGIFVRAMGGGQVNTVTGDFVFAVTEAYLIRDGKLAEPIRGATLVGNGPKVLSIVDRVGNDLGFIVGTCGKDGQGAPVTDAQPTIRIPELTVGGEVPVSTYWP